MKVFAMISFLSPVI